MSDTIVESVVARLRERSETGKKKYGTDLTRTDLSHKQWLRHLQARRALAGDVDPEHLAIALSSATIGLLSASRLIGPLNATQLEGAVEALARMVSAFEA